MQTARLSLLCKLSWQAAQSFREKTASQGYGHSRAGRCNTQTRRSRIHRVSHTALRHAENGGVSVFKEALPTELW